MLSLRTAPAGLPGRGLDLTPDARRAVRAAREVAGATQHPGRRREESAMADPAAARPAEVDDRSVGDLVSEAVSDITQLVKYQTDLAKQELLADVRRIGVSAGLGATIVVTSFLMLVMLCFALAYGLQTLGVWDWASFLIVTGVLIVLAAAFAGIIYLKVRRLDRLRKTRESVQGDIALLRRDEQAGPPATMQR
jgi:uncharacterized membrane protein YqjE